RRVVECLSRDRTKHQVAEVTSLGLVQMTRKKLGLGLVESFSENCEVCAGRGIIVHHEPVFRHRQESMGGPQGGSGSSSGQSGQGSQNGSTSSRGRRGRGGSGGSLQAPSMAPKNGHGPTGTHAITDDVRNALAQIAKSTVPHTDSVEHGETSATVSGAVRGGASGGVSGVVANSVAVEHSSMLTRAEEAAGAAAEAAVEILEIPVPAARSSRGSRRISTQDAEEILDSVLGALPEPKQPGQGRSRGSRRASSSGAVVTPTGTTE
ncbi:MAG: ribonuclease E/G, partial [Actinomycetota bacterium]|nr:ribonuclease E/G [Actinomycetota bacterium]